MIFRKDGKGRHAETNLGFSHSSEISLNNKTGRSDRKNQSALFVFSKNVAHLHLYFCLSSHSPILKSGELAKAVMEG